MQKIAKKLLNTIIYILALSTLLGTITVHAAPASESVNKLKKEKNKLQSALDDLQDELTAVMSEMDTLERSMAAKGEEIYEAEIALEEAQKREIEQQEAMGKRIGAMYENSTSMNLWSIIFQEASLADILKRADNVQAIYQYDKNALEEYQQTKAEIDELKTTLESEMEELQVLAEDYEKKQANVNALIEKKEKELKDCEEDLQVAIKKAAEEAARKAAEEARKKAEAEAKRKAEEEAKKKAEAEKNGQGSSSDKSETSSDKKEGTTSKPTGDSSVGAAIVSEARTYLGVPYRWGGTSRSGIDCSGLTQACHRAVGLSIPRVSGDQRYAGRSVDGLSNALPGDIICYPGHVGIYIGNNMMIHAPQTGDVVKISHVSLGRTKPIVAIRRCW